MLVETWIDLHKAVIDRLAVRVKNQLDDAKSVVDRIEQISIAFAAVVQRLLGELALVDITQHGPQFKRALGILRDGGRQLYPKLRAVTFHHAQLA